MDEERAGPPRRVDAGRGPPERDAEAVGLDPPAGLALGEVQPRQNALRDPVRALGEVARTGDDLLAIDPFGALRGPAVPELAED
ncbi:MAG TPA: hypothetical protein VI300_18370 [Solirubrobacter sp.]